MIARGAKTTSTTPSSTMQGTVRRMASWAFRLHSRDLATSRCRIHLLSRYSGRLIPVFDRLSLISTG